MTPSVPAVELLLRHAREFGLDRLDAEVLLAEVCTWPRSRVIAHPERQVETAAADRFLTLARRRAAGEPLAYLLGRRGFMDIEVEVSADVLIPRPETELLVTTALALDLPPEARILDLGTGSGAIALALAKARPDWDILATDVSSRALKVARRNVRRIAPGRVHLVASDWFSALAPVRFDLLVSNPPYVAVNDPELDSCVADHEPPRALFAANDGLAALAQLASTAPERLEPGGWILLEHGHRQGPSVRAMLEAAGLSAVRSIADGGERERVTIARRNGLPGG